MTEQEDQAEPESSRAITDTEVEEWFESEDETPSSVVNVSDGRDIVERYTDAQLRIVRSTMDLSLHGLRQSLGDNTYINVHPDYQRRHRWDTKKRSQLIESLLLNIPIPPLFLFENDYNQYEVMDGRQRLDAISQFLDNTYALRGLEYWPELDGSTFGDLPPTIQRGLLRRTVTAIVLLAETSRPDVSEIDIRMALFKRLNTGGVKLNPQELRNALYPSAFNSMLIRVAESDIFRDVWTIPRYTLDEKEKVPKKVQTNVLYKTMADCELVLRFFAIRETILEERRGSLRSLMDKSVRQHKADTVEMASFLESDYLRNLTVLFEVFDGKPFVLPQTNRTSRPLYDALMVAASLLDKLTLGARKATIQERFMAAINDPGGYEILVGRGNTVEAIKERVQLAKQILD